MLVTQTPGHCCRSINSGEGLYEVDGGCHDADGGAHGVDVDGYYVGGMSVVMMMTLVSTMVGLAAPVTLAYVEVVVWCWLLVMSLW